LQYPFLSVLTNLHLVTDYSSFVGLEVLTAVVMKSSAVICDSRKKPVSSLHVINLILQMDDATTQLLITVIWEGLQFSLVKSIKYKNCSIMHLKYKVDDV
jgi:hypothetical protein